MCSRPAFGDKHMELRLHLERLVARLRRRGPLDEEDRAALLALPFEKRKLEAGRYLVREGGSTDVSSLILSGLAVRHKLTADGVRQIVSVHVSGDFVDLEGSLLKVADHNVQALTRLEIAAVPVQKILALIDRHPRVGRALWVDTLVDASIYREWALNVGRRPARQRIGHLLC